MSRNWNGFRGSATAKVIVIAGVALLLLIPLQMTEHLIVERSSARDRASLAVAAAWGGRQTIGGPVLVIPFRHSIRDRQGVARRVHTELYSLPRELTIEGGADTQVLRRGIYRIPVYSVPLSVTGRLRPVTIDPAVFTDPEILWQTARILLPVSDPRTLRETVTLQLGQQQIEFGPGQQTELGPVLAASLADVDPALFTADLDFALELTLAGTGSLDFRPDADVTRVSLRSDWASPSFHGASLPERRDVAADGFTADWRVLSLGRGYPATWLDADGPAAPAGTFGVEFLVPVDVHTSSLRAIKYAALFLAVTFAAFFLFEVLARTRLHPVQYLSIGLANGIFYLLLLALAEHAGFSIAYCASAVASTTLIVGYAAAVLGSTRRVASMAALVTGLYAYLYAALRAEDYALVVGALGLFTLLTGFMYATRHIDWYAIELDSSDTGTTAAGHAAAAR